MNTMLSSRAINFRRCSSPSILSINYYNYYGQKVTSWDSNGEIKRDWVEKGLQSLKQKLFVCPFLRLVPVRVRLAVYGLLSDGPKVQAII